MTNNRLHTIGLEPPRQGIPTHSSPFLGSDRTALLVTALFVFSVISIPKFNLAEAIAFAAFPLFLMIAAKLSAKVILLRLLLLSPFVLFMAAGNLLLDRTPMLRLSEITITGGMISGMVVVLKTMITVAGMLSVTLALPFHRICRALRAFHIPEVLVTQLMLLYRYTGVLQEEAAAMQKARDMRSFGNKGKELFRTAPLIGSLLLRTTSRAERIHRAMSARGFQGKMASHNHEEKITQREWITVGVWSLVFLALHLIF